MAFLPSHAMLTVLAFLGTVGLLALAASLGLYGLLRGKPRVVQASALAGLLVGLLYAGALLAASAAS